MCDRVIVLDDDTWQQGIIGIVSSRITEKYGLPSILISFDGATRGYPSNDDLGKGSGRSIKGMNLVEALASCEDLFNVMAEAGEMGINLIEAGHFFTEQPVTQFFQTLLHRLDPDMYIEIMDSNVIRLI